MKSFKNLSRAIENTLAAACASVLGRCESENERARVKPVLIFDGMGDLPAHLSDTTPGLVVWDGMGRLAPEIGEMSPWLAATVESAWAGVKKKAPQRRLGARERKRLAKAMESAGHSGVGADAVFSAPMSFSMIYATASPEAREALRDARRRTQS